MEGSWVRHDVVVIEMGALGVYDCPSFPSSGPFDVACTLEHRLAQAQRCLCS